MATLEAWEKFIVGAPEAQREYRTLELYHPQLDKVYRFVSNSIDVNLTLESTAPRNAGETVLFTAITAKFIEPAESGSAGQVFTAEFGNADDTVHRISDQISGTGFLTPTESIYRKYYSGDLSQPATPPLYLFASDLGFDGKVSCSFTAEDSDLSQKRSGANYITSIFRGLAE